MDFNESKPIYLQIVDYAISKIIDNYWNEQERIPSVRELGSDLGVNPNTIMRAYEWLDSRDIIFNRRGLGYFVIQGAKDKIIALKRHDFFEQEVPMIAQKILQLSISKEELQRKIEEEINIINHTKQLK